MINYFINCTKTWQKIVLIIKNMYSKRLPPCLLDRRYLCVIAAEPLMQPKYFPYINSYKTAEAWLGDLTQLVKLTDNLILCSVLINERILTGNNLHQCFYECRKKTFFGMVCHKSFGFIRGRALGGPFFHGGLNINISHLRLSCPFVHEIFHFLLLQCVWVAHISQSFMITAAY